MHHLRRIVMAVIGLSLWTGCTTTTRTIVRPQNPTASNQPGMVASTPPKTAAETVEWGWGVDPDVTGERMANTRGAQGFWDARNRSTPPAQAWLVGRFEEADNWLAAYPEFQPGSDQFSRSFSQLVARHLKEDSQKVFTIHRELSNGQINQLVVQGLRYMCSGYLKQLHHLDKQEDGYANRYGELVVSYELRRWFGGKMMVVQTNRVVADTRIADRLQPRHVEHLLDRAAQQVASEITGETAQDIMGMVDVQPR